MVRAQKLKVLADKYIVKSWENYRGLSYGDMIIRWQRWLLSDNPDQHQHGDILFLRGSIGYHRHSSKYFESSIEICEGIPILVPIVTTHYNLGERYKGLLIQDEFSLRRAVKEHVDSAGPFWAILEMNESHTKVFKLVPNLESFRVESMLFELNISEHNPFLDKMDEPNYPGKYTAMVAGYFVLLRDLPASSYRIRFGGYGMDGFYTDSLYEIKIKSTNMPIKDISGQKFLTNDLLNEKKNSIEARS